MTEITEPTSRQVKPRRNYDMVAWKWMRYSGFLLVPLVFIHVALNDVIIGVHAIDIDVVEARWAFVGWRLYSAAILAFAFAHGMNGLRQVLDDYIHAQRTRQIMGWVLFFVWLIITLMGAIALVGGVRPGSAAS
jgi:succinate dehydrogenase / fumarate reductase, membrane anchor subunit